MPVFGAAAKFAADFLSNIINGVVNKWMQMNESRKRGEAEAKNVAHEENAKRKAKSDKVMEKPVKKGKNLTDSMRKRTKSKSAD
tara:strand:+ start:180 stop:431 length:252 start_codon:yes stop_codon:yes gene_type:complete